MKILPSLEFSFLPNYAIVFTALFILSFPLNSFSQEEIEAERQQREEHFQQNFQADFCHTMAMIENQVEPEDYNFDESIIERLRRLRQSSGSNSRSSGGIWSLTDGYGVGCDNDCTKVEAASCTGTGSELFRVPIVHTVSTTAGCTNGVPTQAEIDAQLNMMNDFFACQGIDIEFFSKETKMMDIGCVYDAASVNNEPNVINIFVFSNTGNGTGCNGFAYLPNGISSPNTVVMGHGCYSGFNYTAGTLDCSNPSLGSSVVLIHELGHYLGLYHTHEPHELGDTNPPATPTDDGCTTGDFIADTCADPNIPDFGTDSDSDFCADTWSGTTDDTGYNGQTGCIQTFTNIMSYNNFSGCRYEFTPCQKAKMVDALLCARGPQICCRDVAAEFSGGNGPDLEICINDALPTFTASSDCYVWYDGLGSAANQIGTGTTFTPTTAQLDVTCPGVTTFYLGDLNEINPECRTPVTVTVLSESGTASSTSTLPITSCSTAQNIDLTTDVTKLGENCVVGWWITEGAPNTSNITGVNSATIGGTLANPVNNIFESTGGTPTKEFSLSVDCSTLDNSLTYYATPVVAKSKPTIADQFCNGLQGNGGHTSVNSGTVDGSISTVDFSSCMPIAPPNSPTFSIKVNVTSFTETLPATLSIRLRNTNNTNLVSTSTTISALPTMLTFTEADFPSGYDPRVDGLKVFLINFNSAFTLGSPTIQFNYDIDVIYPGEPAIVFPSITSYNDCLFGDPVQINCNCNNCPTLAAPIALSIAQESTCGTSCAPSGGAWNLAASPCPAGSSLQSFPNATATTGGTAMTTAPTYNQIMAETYNVRCVCDSDATMVSPVQTVTSVPGTCTLPLAPTLTITNNSCPTTTGSIVANGAGGTLHYFTGTSLADAMSNAMLNTGPSTVVPTYAAFPTVVHICVVETDTNGCRSSSTCKSTVPVDCTVPCPTFATPTALAISSESSCMANCTPAGGAWTLAPTPCPTGSSLQSFPNATVTTGGTAMTTAPTYNQTTAETFHVRCVCGSDPTMVSIVQTITSTPGACIDPTAPTLTITDNTCPSTTGTIAATGAGGTLNYFTGADAATVMSNATNNIGGTTSAPAYAVFPTTVNVCVVETDANGCRSAPSCGVTAPLDCCPIFVTPTALSVTSQSTCAANCAPAGGVWALATTPCPTGSSLQSFPNATATTGGTAMTAAPTYNQTVAETFHVRCVCDLNASKYSAVQTITSVPGTCTDPTAPTLTITDNTCPSTTGTIAATGAGGGLNYFTGADAATAMSNATNNIGGTTGAPAYAVFPTTVNVCVVETDANGCRSAPSCGVTAPVDCSCSITNANPTNIQCNDNNTPNDPLDDFITFSINPTGNNLGSTYSIAGATPSSVNYGTSTIFSMASGSAGAGGLNLTVVDDTDATCSFSIVVTDPGACSNFVFIGNNTGGTAFMAKDPCTCNGDQVLNANGSVAVAGTFSETVTVNGPPNLNVRIKTIGASTGTDPSLMTLPLTETPLGSGTYIVTFNHIDRIGYNISEFEFSTAADPLNFMVVMGADGFTPVSVTNRCAYPRIVCSPALASSMDITDTPINLSLTELSTDVTFPGGVSTFTINGTTSAVFDPANSPAIVGNNTIVANYDFTSGSGQGGLAAPGAPAIPIDADNDPNNGVCPISLPAKTVNVVGEEQPIPTMSQWGLIIFGLLILNMVVVLLYRKEQLLLE